MEKRLECTGCGRMIPADSRECPYCHEAYDERRIPFSPYASLLAGWVLPDEISRYDSAAVPDERTADPQRGIRGKTPIQVMAWPKDGRPLPVGSITAFGRWPQEAPVSEPILWRVLEVRENAVLLLSERTLAVQPYHTEQGLVCWKETSIRRWLNEPFFKNAFHQEERASVIRAAMPDLDYHGAGERTAPIYDAVFLLCADEVKKYLPRRSSRVALPTAQVRTGGAFIDPSTGSSRWWLRSPRKLERTALYVDTDGSVDSNGTSMSRTTICVRPALYRRISRGDP